ncbi:membrane protein [Streptomyces showdoensis]
MAWLGLSLGLLTLGITAYTTQDPTLTEAAYRVMKVFADWLLAPVALPTLGSGLVLSLGTPWGLARHRWVWIKFWITLATAAATVFALRPEITHAAASGVPDSSLVAAPVVSTSAYLFMTAISVLKPWGLTRRGRRLREAARSGKAVDAPAPLRRA